MVQGICMSQDGVNCLPAMFHKAFGGFDTAPSSEGHLHWSPRVLGPPMVDPPHCVSPRPPTNECAELLSVPEGRESIRMSQWCALI
jgi:hypothetical protein